MRPIATEENNILQKHSLTKEEVTFSNTNIIDVPSLESNILAFGRKDKALKKPFLQEFKPTKYVIHSSISSLDHFGEFEEAYALKQKEDILMKIKSDPQVVPDTYLLEPTVTQGMRNFSHIVPSPADDMMDTSEISLHDLPSQGHKPIEQKVNKH